MALVISLFDLANLSIGTPEVGAVNFNALHTLLHAILKHLNIKDVKTEIPEEDRSLYKPPPAGLIQVEEGQNGRGSHTYHELQSKVLKMERQLEALNTLPTAPDLLGRTKVQDGGASPVEDMWQMMQMRKKLEANENGVSKTMTLIQELIHEIISLRDSQHKVEGQLQRVDLGNLQELEQRLSCIEEVERGDVGTIQKEMESMKEQVKDLEDKLAKFPNSEELNNMVHWEVLREALVTRPQDYQAVLPSGPGVTPMYSNTNVSVQAVRPVQVTEVTQTDGPTFSISSSQTLMTQAQGHSTSGDSVTVLEGGTYTSLATQSKQLERGKSPTHPGGPLPRNTATTQRVASLESTHSPGSPRGAHHSSNTTDSKSQQRVLQNGLSSSDQTTSHPTLPLHHSIQEDTTKSSSSPSHPDFHNNLRTRHNSPSWLPHCRAASQRYADTVMALNNIGTLSEKCAVLITRVEALERDKVDRTELMQGIDHIKNLPDLQEKLNSLYREVDDLKEDRVCHSSQSIDQMLQNTSEIDVHLGNLRASIQEIEKELTILRDKQGNMDNMELSLDDTSRRLQQQDGKRLDPLQYTISQLQEECARLNKTTGSLIQDKEQKQAHIEILYQSLEKLDKKKADKEHIELEIDVKADKRALEGKVSRTRFDATTEQLGSMIQDLLDRVSGQEQDWQRMLERINLEMQRKLDRMELDPFKNKLENRWREIRQLLKEHPPHYECDEAAGIRKQLISRFNCISCDRPVDMMVPGPQILTIPNLPGLPPHPSNRPYTVYELEQVRQLGRSDRFPEMSDYGYMSSSRSCGGSHTLTFAHRRYARLQAIAPCTPQEEEVVLGGIKGEVDILGLDGHIYRGRMDARFPAIRTKDGNPKSHVKCTQGSHRSLLSWENDTPLYRPQSATSNGRNSVMSHTSQDPQDRPGSAFLSCLQPQADHPSRSQESLGLRMDTAVKSQQMEKFVV